MTKMFGGLQTGERAILDDYSLELTARDADRLGSVGGVVPTGALVSVPHLPGEDSEGKLAGVRTIRDLGYEPMPHIAVRRFESALQLERVVAGLVEHAHVDRLLVLAGDVERPQGPYPDTLAVLRSGLIEKYGIRHVAVAGHPEGHPQVDKATLAASLLEKQQLLGELGVEWSIMTQFAFSAEPVLDWIESTRGDGVEVPIRIGVPGPASVGTLLRFAAVCGVSASTSVLKKYGLSVTQLLSSAGPDRLVADYARSMKPGVHGDTRLHFYPFGGVGKTAEWIAKFNQP